MSGIVLRDQLMQRAYCVAANVTVAMCSSGVGNLWHTQCAFVFAVKLISKRAFDALINEESFLKFKKKKRS